MLSKKLIILVILIFSFVYAMNLPFYPEADETFIFDVQYLGEGTDCLNIIPTSVDVYPVFGNLRYKANIEELCTFKKAKISFKISSLDEQYAPSIKINEEEVFGLDKTKTNSKYSYTSYSRNLTEDELKNEKQNKLEVLFHIKPKFHRLYDISSNRGIGHVNFAFKQGFFGGYECVDCFYKEEGDTEEEKPINYRDKFGYKKYVLKKNTNRLLFYFNPKNNGVWWLRTIILTIFVALLSSFLWDKFKNKKT